VHYHYIESMTSVVCWLLIGGLLYPWVAVAFGGAYIVGRIIFTIGYMTKGPRGRGIGFAICMISGTVLFVFSFVSPI
jgi:glutathione S-transferase